MPAGGVTAASGSRREADPGGGRSDRWLERRTEIVDQAAEVFARLGYDGAGLSDLCDAVGLGRGALYHYIESKQNLLGLVHDRVMDEVLAGGRSIARSDRSPTTKLCEMSHDLLRIIATYPHHFRVFLREPRALEGGSPNRFSQRRREYEDLVAEVVQGGVDEGTFVVEDVRLTVLGWLAIHHYANDSDVGHSPSGGYRPEQLSRVFSSMVLDGIVRRVDTGPGQFGEPAARTNHELPGEPMPGTSGS